jgi:hypothetical protein
MPTTPTAATTGPEKLLLAALDLQRGAETFTAAALCVRAWERWPETFGLEGFDHPDMNKVVVCLVGLKGMVKKGLLVKTGPKRYHLSGAGRIAAAAFCEGGLPPDLKEPPPESEAPPASADEARSALLERLLESDAWDLARRGEAASLTFMHACDFWADTDRADAVLIDARILEVTDTLTGSACPGGLVTRGGRFVSTAELKRLLDLHCHLRERFSKHLRLLRSRTNRKEIRL